MDNDNEGPWPGTDAAQRLPVGRRSLVVLLATVPGLGIGIALLALLGLKSVLIDVGLREPDVQVPVLPWLSPCGRTLITGSATATVSVERGHHPHELVESDGRGFPLSHPEQVSDADRTCSATLDSAPMPDFVPHGPLSMLGRLEIDLPDGKSVSKFTDSEPSGRTMFLAIDTSASSPQALATLDHELRAASYQPGPVTGGVTTYSGTDGTVSVHIGSVQRHSVTVVIAQHAPAISSS